MSTEFNHRSEKRIREVRLAIDVLRPLLKDRDRLRALEFGSGSGVQADVLSELGDVVASDIDCCGFTSQKGVNCVECDISSTSFEGQQFDLIYSNHVVEHLEDVKAAFAEIRRLGKPGCIYAFSVPTNLWLLLTIPAQIYSKLSILTRMFRNRLERPIPRASSVESDRLKDAPIRARVYRVLGGHGVETNFLRCYDSFKVEQWRRTFESHDFTVIGVHKLLLYGPSEFPVIPTMPPLVGKYASSVLFVLR